MADAVYRIYADEYSYDHTPFDVRIESTDDASPRWRHEVVSMATVYGGERMPVHLYLPKNVKPPYQPVLFFPGALAIGAANSADLQLNVFGIDFIMMSGRTWVQQLVSDARRTVDYLETRRDIDAARLAYFGLSWGAQLGPITIALDPRIKAGVLLMGGLKSGNSAPGRTPARRGAPARAYHVVETQRDLLFWP